MLGSNFRHTRSLLEIFLAQIFSYFLALWNQNLYISIVHIQVRFMLLWASGHAFIAIKRALHFQDTLA